MKHFTKIIAALTVAAAAVASGQGFEVYETKISARTSDVKELKVTVNDFSKQAKNGKQPTYKATVHFRAPVTKNCTILMANGKVGREYVSYGQMWSNDKQISAFVQLGSDHPYGHPASYNKIGNKGLNKPTEYYYELVSEDVGRGADEDIDDEWSPVAKTLNFTGVAALEAKGAREGKIASSVGWVDGYGFYPLACTAKNCPYAELGFMADQGMLMYPPYGWGNDEFGAIWKAGTPDAYHPAGAWAHTFDSEGYVDPEDGIYYSIREEAHFHGSYAKRYNKKLADSVTVASTGATPADWEQMKKNVDAAVPKKQQSGLVASPVIDLIGKLGTIDATSKDDVLKAWEAYMKLSFNAQVVVNNYKKNGAGVDYWTKLNDACFALVEALIADLPAPTDPAFVDKVAEAWDTCKNLQMQGILSIDDAFEDIFYALCEALAKAFEIRVDDALLAGADKDALMALWDALWDMPWEVYDFGLIEQETFDALAEAMIAALPSTIATPEDEYFLNCIWDLYNNYGASLSTEGVEKLEETTIAIVVAIINDLEPVTAKSMGAVHAAWWAVEILGMNYGLDVDSDAYDKLEAATFEMVKAIIDALPETITAKNAASMINAVDVAWDAYMRLDNVYGLNPSDLPAPTKAKLDNTTIALSEFLINALPANISPKNEAAVQAAWRFYMGFVENNTEISLDVSPAVLTKLKTAITSLAEAFIKALPKTIKPDNAFAVGKAWEWCDIASTDATPVSATSLENLKTATRSLIGAVIAAIPANGAMTPKLAEGVYYAYELNWRIGDYHTAFDGAQRNKLEEAYDNLYIIGWSLAARVRDMIDALPGWYDGSEWYFDEVATWNYHAVKAAVVAARKAYDALPEWVKEYPDGLGDIVWNYDKLVGLEITLLLMERHQ